MNKPTEKLALVQPVPDAENAVKEASARRENFMYAALEKIAAEVETGTVTHHTLLFVRRAISEQAYAERYCKQCGGDLHQSKVPEVFICPDCGIDYTAHSVSVSVRPVPDSAPNEDTR